MAKKAEATDGIMPEKPTLEAFREAIQHVLMKESGAPEMVAKALIESEDDYIRGALDGGWGKDGRTASLVLEVATEIAIREPPGKQKWVVLEEGMTVVEEGAVFLDTSGPVGAYLDALLNLGLYGDTRKEVAMAMMVRGIEGVFHLLPPTALIRKR